MFLSLCMIVKNEEENIKECLDKVLEIVDEAIIVDTGSTDRTRNILQEYEKIEKVTILDYVWENDFSKARNKSIEKATGDYILILDADERLFCNIAQLEEVLKETGANAYTLPIYNIYENKEMTVSNSMIRLYKNNNPKYSGAIHEQLELDGKTYLGESIDENVCKLYHFGYSKKAFELKDKQKRNMDIINSEIKINPHDPFNWYNKGVMEMISGNLEKAIDDFIKSHNLCNGRRMAFHNDLLIRMMQCMLMQKKYRECINFINSLKTDPDIIKMPDIYYYLGYAYKETKKYEQAIKSFKKAIETGENSNGISKYGAGSYLSLIEWAQILQKKNNVNESIEKYKEAVFHPKNINKQGYKELIELLSGQNRQQQIQEMENKISVDLDRSKNQEELEKYKIEFKNNIQNLLQEGNTEDTKKLISEYEKIVENDIDVFSFKGITAMIEGNNYQALEIFQQGILNDARNFDLIYNSAYIYHLMEDYKMAFLFYNKAYKYAKSDNVKIEIKSILNEYEDKYDFSSHEED